MSERANRNKANALLAAISRRYYDAIPLDALLDAARIVGEPVQEDGTPWSGLLCGRTGRASIELAGSKAALQLQWYRMGAVVNGTAARYEVNAYIS
jgi:hypothetical protein